MNALLFVVVVVAIGVWAWAVASYYVGNPPKPSTCTGDCNQGRACDCGEPVDLSSWPFPKSKP